MKNSQSLPIAFKAPLNKGPRRIDFGRRKGNTTTTKVLHTVKHKVGASKGFSPTVAPYLGKYAFAIGTARVCRRSRKKLTRSLISSVYLQRIGHFQRIPVAQYQYSKNKRCQQVHIVSVRALQASQTRTVAAARHNSNSSTEQAVQSKPYTRYIFLVPGTRYMLAV